MKSIEERVKKESIIIDNDIIKVDSFVNHQIDVDFVKEVGQYFADQFKDREITKILTIETSGVAFAIGASLYFNDVPVVFAKKSKSKIVDENAVYHSQTKSFTRGVTSDVTVSKKYLSSADKVLIVDDFLAEGNASLGLLDICEQAGAQVQGFAVVIDKVFQGGRKKLEDKGYRVVAGAKIKEFLDNVPIFEE